MQLQVLELLKSSLHTMTVLRIGCVQNQHIFKESVVSQHRVERNRPTAMHKPRLFDFNPYETTIA